MGFVDVVLGLAGIGWGLGVWSFGGGVGVLGLKVYSV